MKALSAVVFGLVVFAFATSAQAQEDFAKKIVGTWVLDKSSGDLPPGTTVEFTKDGKLVVVAKADNQELKIDGTYKVEKDKLTIKVKLGDQTHEETATITKLDDKVLEVKDKDGKVDGFKKKAK